MKFQVTVEHRNVPIHFLFTTEGRNFSCPFCSEPINIEKQYKDRKDQETEETGALISWEYSCWKHDCNTKFIIKPVINSILKFILMSVSLNKKL